MRDPLELVVSAYLYHYSTPPDWQVRAFLPFGLAARIHAHATHTKVCVCVFLPLTPQPNMQPPTNIYKRQEPWLYEAHPLSNYAFILDGSSCDPGDKKEMSWCVRFSLSFSFS